MPITAATTPLPTGTWSVDPVHSRVEFEVRQLGVATVRGAFHEFEGTLELHEDLAAARGHGSVTVASLDTNQKRRDAHLRSPDFLDAERNPRIAFDASEIRALGAETFEIVGDLTIRGVTRPITLTAELQGTEDPWGHPRVALAVAGRLNRADYGVTPNPVLNLMVSDEVELRLDISAVKQI